MKEKKKPGRCSYLLKVMKEKKKPGRCSYLLKAMREKKDARKMFIST